MVDRNKIYIACALIVFSLIIGWMVSSYAIEFYFSNQPTYTIGESKERLYLGNNKPDSKAIIMPSRVASKDAIFLGQSIVLYGFVDNDFVLHSSGDNITLYNNKLQLIPVIDRINCMPFREGYYKIVGAYNRVNTNYEEPIESITTKFDAIDNIIDVPESISSEQLRFFVVWFLNDCKEIGS